VTISFSLVVIHTNEDIKEENSNDDKKENSNDVKKENSDDDKKENSNDDKKEKDSHQDQNQLLQQIEKQKKNIKPSCCCEHLPHETFPGIEHYLNNTNRLKTSSKLSSNIDKRITPPSDQSKKETVHDDDNDVV
jgi:hypothetical protein